MFAARAPAHGAHLDLLGATSETAGLAAGVLGPLSLSSRVRAHRVGSHYVHVGGTGMHLGGIVGVRDIVGGGGCRAGETGGMRGMEETGKKGTH